MSKNIREERLEIFEKVIEMNPHIERKGKTMPYTSANGHMFSQLNKDGEIGFRFSKEDQKKFMEEHGASLFKSYGATMRGYVTIPDEMLEDLDTLASYLNKSYEYVMSLDPK